MNIVKLGLLALLVAGGLSGCDILREGRDAVRGGPRINDNVFLLRNGGVNEPYAAIPAVIPRPCRPGPDHPIFVQNREDRTGLTDELASNAPDYSRDELEEYALTLDKHPDKLDACVDAMRELIDARWYDFEHVLNGSLATSNFLIDGMITGLTTSIPLVAPGTKNVLGAIAAGLAGTRKNFDEDVLYSYSIQVVLQQMRTDRAAQRAVIEAHLGGNTNRYRNIYQAEADLLDYSRAGSWDHAMASLQTNIAAQTAACQARLRDQMLSKTTDTHADGQPATSTTTDPCNSAKPVAAATSGQAADASNGLAIAFTTGIKPDGKAAAALDEAGTIYKTGGYDKIQVTGTTTGGPGVKGNAQMAARRANFVMTELKNRGVDTVEIVAPAAKDFSAGMGARVVFHAKDTVAPDPRHSSDAGMDTMFASGTRFRTANTKVVEYLTITKAPDKDGNNAEYTLKAGDDPPGTPVKASVADILKIVSGSP